MVWRLIEFSEAKNPNFNLAVEEALFRCFNVEGIMRFWHNDNTVVIGRFQCPLSEINYERVLELKTRVVRRFTGGGAVYHDLGNLNFTFIFKARCELPQAFELIGSIISSALRNLGLNARFKPMNDVIVNSKKIAGLAGMVLGDRILIHGCLLVNSSLDVLSSVLSVSKEKLIDKAVSSVRERVTTISIEVGKDIPQDDIKHEILKAAKGMLGFKRIVDDQLSSDELKCAQRLYNERYKKAEWLGLLCRACPLKDHHWHKVEELSEVAKADTNW